MKYIMWRNLIIIAAAAAGLSVAVAASADARPGGMGGREGVNANANMRGFDARAQGRGPEVTPRGWSHGRKTGWNCRVGARGCVPPGLR